MADNDQIDALRQTPGWRMFKAAWDERAKQARLSLETMNPLDPAHQLIMILAQQLLLDYTFCFGPDGEQAEWEVETLPAGEHAISLHNPNK